MYSVSVKQSGHLRRLRNISTIHEPKSGRNGCNKGDAVLNEREW